MRRQEILDITETDCSEKYQRMANYKTYKIVFVLQVVCRLAVMKIRLKWMLNDNDELVLTDCL